MTVRYQRRTVAGTGIGPASDADVTELASLIGHTVRVGGLVTELRPDGFRLDDGTAVGTVTLRGPAADLVALVEVGDAINATGSVETAPDGPIVVVADPAGLVLAGSPSTSPIPAPVRRLGRDRGRERGPQRRAHGRRPSARRPRAVPR